MVCILHKMAKFIFYFSQLFFYLLTFKGHVFVATLQHKGCKLHVAAKLKNWIDQVFVSAWQVFPTTYFPHIITCGHAAACSPRICSDLGVFQTSLWANTIQQMQHYEWRKNAKINISAPWFDCNLVTWHVLTHDRWQNVCQRSRWVILNMLSAT